MVDFWSSATMVAAVVAASATEAETGTLAPRVGSETSLCSLYVWRGLVLDRKPALQSSTNVTLGAYSFGVWSTSRASRAAKPGSVDEFDFSLSQESTAGNLTAIPGLTYYAIGGASNDTAEASLSFGYDADPLYFYFDNYLDVMASGGAYFGSVGVSTERRAGERLCLGADLSLGWANTRFTRANVGVGQTGFNSATIELYAIWQISPGLTLRPSLSASGLIGSRLRRAVEKPDNVILGVTIGVGG